MLEVYERDPSTGTYARIGELITYQNLNWTRRANRPNSASFSMNIYSQEGRFIQPFKNWILIKRNGFPEFFGNIIDLRGDLNPDTGLYTVDCADVLYRLKKTNVEGQYIKQNTDASAIAAELVGIAQSKSYGNLGIQTGTLETVGNTNETLYYQSIGDALINQADNLTGYILTFVPILDANGKVDYIQFNVHKSLGAFRSDLPPLELGTSVNVAQFAMGEDLVNKVYTLGAGTGDVQVVETESEGSQQIFGLVEEVNKESSIEVRDTLSQRGRKFIDERQGIKLEVAFTLTPGVKPYYGDFGLMDTLKVNVVIGNTVFNFRGTAQIREINMSYDTVNNQESLTPVISYYKT